MFFELVADGLHLLFLSFSPTGTVDERHEPITNGRGHTFVLRGERQGDTGASELLLSTTRLPFCLPVCFSPQPLLLFHAPSHVEQAYGRHLLGSVQPASGSERRTEGSDVVGGRATPTGTQVQGKNVRRPRPALGVQNASNAVRAAAPTPASATGEVSDVNCLYFLPNGDVAGGPSASCCSSDPISPSQPFSTIQLDAPHRPAKTSVS